MSCFKCGSKYLSSRKFTLRELAKGSPSKGKNKKYVEVQVSQTTCQECKSQENVYK